MVLPWRSRRSAGACVLGRAANSGNTDTADDTGTARIIPFVRWTPRLGDAHCCFFAQQCTAIWRDIAAASIHAVRLIRSVPCHPRSYRCDRAARQAPVCSEGLLTAGTRTPRMTREPHGSFRSCDDRRGSATHIAVFCSTTNGDPVRLSDGQRSRRPAYPFCSASSAVLPWRSRRSAGACVLGRAANSGNTDTEDDTGTARIFPFMQRPSRIGDAHRCFLFNNERPSGATSRRRAFTPSCLSELLRVIRGPAVAIAPLGRRLQYQNGCQPRAHETHGVRRVLATAVRRSRVGQYGRRVLARST